MNVMKKTNRETEKVYLTRGKRLYCVGLDEDLGNKRRVAVVNFFFEFQLRPRDILGVKQSERLRSTARARTLINKSIVYHQVGCADINISSSV